MKWYVYWLPIVLFLAANSQIAIYEAESFPEDEGWERVGSGRAERELNNGSFVQAIRIEGALDGYRKSIAEFADETRFFIEWRVQTDAPSSLLDTSRTPVALVAGGKSAAFYHTTITDSRVQLFRDTSIPLVFVDIEASLSHTYRLELVGSESYGWYIDGQVVDGGVPQGPYPNPDSRITWSSRYYVRDLPVQTTRWDFVRYGRIPEDASGDFDSSKSIELFDFYFLHECLTNERLGINGGPGNDSGPGCRWADIMDADGDVDLADFAAFQNLFDGGH